MRRSVRPGRSGGSWACWAGMGNREWGIVKSVLASSGTSGCRNDGFDDSLFPIPTFWDNAAMAKNSSNKTGKDKGKGAAGGPALKTIALNKRSRHEYHLEERFEA